MILNDDQANARLRSPKNLANVIAELRNKKKIENDILAPVTTIHEGRDLPRLPDEVKDEIASKALAGLETQSELAAQYGITQAAVSYLKRTREPYTPNPQRAPAQSSETQEQSLDRSAKELAIQKMLLAMGLINEDKLARAKATDLAQVAASMSKVVSNVTPKAAVPLVNLVVYAPEIRDESKFRIVELGKQEDVR